MQKLDYFYYICAMKSTDAIPKRIEAIGAGVIFGYSDLDFPPEMQAATAKALSRMVAEGKLRKVGKGKFYMPVISRLGEMPPMIEQLTKDLIFKDGKRIGYITGTPAFSQMGLTTQVSSKIIIGAARYRRPLKRGGYGISFTIQPNEITDYSVPLLRILDALKYIRKIPAATPDDIVRNIQEQLKNLSETERTSLINYAENYPPSVRALMGAMLENIGYYHYGIKRSLNPFTGYKLDISANLLPNKSNWNIE